MNSSAAFKIAVSIFPIMAIAGPRLAAQDAVPVCSSVTVENATSVLGVAAKRTNDPSGCVWDDASHQKHLNVAYVAVPSMYERGRSKSATEGKTQDEPGLGGSAFSTIPTSGKGNRLALYCLKGSTVLILDLEEDGAASRLPEMRVVMREMVARL